MDLLVPTCGVKLNKWMPHLLCLVIMLGFISVDT